MYQSVMEIDLVETGRYWWKGGAYVEKCHYARTNTVRR